MARFVRGTSGNTEVGPDETHSTSEWRTWLVAAAQDHSVEEGSHSPTTKPYGEWRESRSRASKYPPMMKLFLNAY